MSKEKVVFLSEAELKWIIEHFEELFFEDAWDDRGNLKSKRAEKIRQKLHTALDN